MNTPIYEFVQRYAAADSSRFHMPGHKGRPFLGCEALDITEVQGADALYEADGIIAESEANAAELFGSAGTFYSTEGSSQCIRAMLYLALVNRPVGTAPVIVAARNVHRAFVYAAALLDFEVVWLWPEREMHSLCGCTVTPETLEKTLATLPAPPAAVYLTSPDYLGGMADIAAFAEVCHRCGTVLAVDNAHGAYLRFLKPSRHPLDQGADLCCDSAHKTLPVLTGGAYLHIGRHVPTGFLQQAKTALAMFGSTSPSYLTLASLDWCNGYLSGEYVSELEETLSRLQTVRAALSASGWQIEESDPLRLTLAATGGRSGTELAQYLRENGVECEYADSNYLVFMVTPENTQQDFERLVKVLGENQDPPARRAFLSPAKGEAVCSIRQALFAPRETIPVAQSFGRICGSPAVSCPPAIPIAVSGERIGQAAVDWFLHCGIQTVEVLR